MRDPIGPGLRFGDFLRALPPAPGARWARLDSSVNLDSDGDPDPYYVSIDLPTAREALARLEVDEHGFDEYARWYLGVDSEAHVSEHSGRLEPDRLLDGRTHRGQTDPGNE